MRIYIHTDDADQWITVNGAHALVGSNGKIKAGLGGKLKGKKSSKGSGKGEKKPEAKSEKPKKTKSAEKSKGSVGEALLKLVNKVLEDVEANSRNVGDVH